MSQSNIGSVQIPKPLFIALLKYFRDGDTGHEAYIRTALDEKLESQINRFLFTNYKTAATPEERENARQRYLDQREIPDFLRTDTERSNCAR